MLSHAESLAHHHDLWLVALAALACLFGSWITMRLYQRVRETDGARKRSWLLLAAVAGGSTVWTTHFLAMLGFRPDLPSSFDVGLTVVSLFVIIAGFGFGFWLAARPGRGPHIETGGAIAGLAIAAMHYLGMAGYRIPGVVVWEPGLVVASIILSMCFAALAVSRSSRPITRWCRYGAALSLVLAICTLHFVGMAAMTVYHDPAIFVPQLGMSNGLLALLIVAAMSLIIGSAFATHYIGASMQGEAQERYRYLARHDPLTNLPNRAHLSEYLCQALGRRILDGSDLAVVAIDLNRFKEINDVYGHSAGDKVLAAVAERLRLSLGPDEFLARVGSDDFIAVKPDCPDRAAVTAFASKLLARIVQPVAADGRMIGLSASAGAALCPSDGTVADDLITRAELALSRAKRNGPGQVCFYEPSMDESVRRRSEFALALKSALRNNELRLHFQPQHSVATIEVIGFEALLRWNRGGEHRISPADFVPIAEETGQIVEIGAWVLREACREAASWKRPVFVAVNVSARQIALSDVVGLVREVLFETGLPASRLELEITESAVISDLNHTLHVLRQLKATGVRIAMDDFGAGYSSLSVLRAFPFDKIKMDRSLMAEADRVPQAAAIIRAVIGLGRSLGIPVLAEGVETMAQMDFLRREGCGEAQGFLLGRPGPIEAFADVVRSSGPRAAPALRRTRVA